MKADYIPPTTWRALYHELVYENALACRVAVETGLRIGDIVALPASSLDEAGYISFTASKTGKSGRKKVSADLHNRLCRIRGSRYVFPGRSDSRKHRTRGAVWKDLHRAAARLGLEGTVSPHSGRKTYAVELYKQSGMKEVIKELQHDREATTLIYALADKITADRVKIKPESDSQIEMIAEKVANKLAVMFGVKSTGEIANTCS